MASDFIGTGIAFPLRTDATGAIALVADDRELVESICLILGTAYGERPMRPEFGCGIHDYVFAPTDATTQGRIGYEVRASLTRWEPRIEVIDISVEAVDGGPTLRIEITYTPRGIYDPRNLVFPFYTIPAEE